MLYLENNHEEADTLMIWLGTAAARCCPQARMVFFTPDTDILVLAVAHYEKLCKNTAISMRTGALEIKPIWSALGRDKARALAAFYAFTGADTVGRFSGQGKTKWFQHYMKADHKVITALMKLTEEGDVTQEVKDTLARFVCSLYCPKGIHITDIPELRWHLFCKHLAESSKLPPTVGALEKHIERVRVQCRVWSQAVERWQCLFNPLHHGYHRNDHGKIQPTTTDVPPAPLAIVELVRYQCKAHCTTQRCSCRRNNLACTDLCLCGSDCENDVDYNAESHAQESDEDM